MVPRLGERYEIDIETIEKPKDEYMTGEYFELDRPVAPAVMVDDEILEKAGKELHDRFGIEHTTIQWERRYQSNQCGSSCEILK